MKLILSPAKNMRQAALPGLMCTRPRFEQETRTLVEHLRDYDPFALESVLSVNPNLAMKAFCTYQDWDKLWEGAALLCYYGLAYQHLRAQDFTLEDFAFAQSRLRILSALYGSLRPTDGMKPYRLEMGARVLVQGASLYSFWGDAVYRDLFSDGEPVINLASGEYTRMFSPCLHQQDPLITVRFLRARQGRYVCPPTLAKMARGSMAGFVIKNRIDSPDGIKQFEEGGFLFAPLLSTTREYVFLMREDSAAL